MLRRLLFGLLKGLLVGAALGAVLHFGLGATTLTGALAYLFYAAVAAVAGVLAGQPPWRQGAWVGSILKGVFGLALGAGLYALAARFLSVQVPAVAGLTTAVPASSAPLFFAPALAALYAGLIELDDGGADAAADAGASGKDPGVRVALPDELGDEEVEVPASGAQRGRGRGRA